jgi:hypothetical protein
MTQEQIKKRIGELQKENIQVEQNLNTLFNSQSNLRKQLQEAEKNIGMKERRISEIKRDVFELTISLNKLVKEQEEKERAEEISKRIKLQPTFNDVLQKELNAILCELREMNFNLGEETTFDELWKRYKGLAESKYLTRETQILAEAKTRYKEMLTILIEKELDGGKIDLIEKRNLKLPIQNFLSNQFIKNELQL